MDKLTFSIFLLNIVIQHSSQTISPFPKLHHEKADWSESIDQRLAAIEAAYQHTIEELTAEVQQLEEENMALNAKLRQLADGEERKRKAGSDGTAFSAHLSKDIHDVGTNRIVTFDSSFVNSNNNYHPRTGVFTCPVSGIYVFHHTIYVNNNQNYIYSEVVKNHQVIDNNLGGPISETGTTVTIAQLDAGDEVWVRTKTHSNNAFIASPLSTFSGFLLYSTV